MNYTPLVLVLLLAALIPWGGVAFALPIPDALDMPPVIYVETPDTPPVVVKAPDQPPDRLNRDAMFVGGATILGLVAFGGLLSAVFAGNAKPAYGKSSAAILTLGVSSASFGSFFLMLTASLPSIDGLFLLSMSLVFAGVLLVVLEIAHVFDAWFKHS